MSRICRVGQYLVRKLSAKLTLLLRSAIADGPRPPEGPAYQSAFRFEAGIKASEPLAELSTKDGSRKAFVEGLNAYDRKMLEKAQVYELRMSSLKLDARRIFPMEIKGYPAATQRLIERFKSVPRDEFLGSEIMKDDRLK